MTTRFSEEGNERMTPQEAEAVLELWARRQGETSKATVGDLAEAMSLPQDEVASMLNEIRRDPNRSEEMRQRRKRNRIWITVGFVGAAIWLACVVTALAFVFSHRRGQTATVYEPPASPDMVMGTTGGAATVAVSEGAATLAPTPMEMTKATNGISTNFEELLPKGITVNLDGYSVEGTVSFTGMTEDALQDTLQQIVYHVAKPLTTTINEPLNESLILQAFLDSNDAQVKNLLRFKDFKVFGPGGNITTKIPVALISNPTLDRMVSEEQARRLTILANQILRMGTAKLSR